MERFSPPRVAATDVRANLPERTTSVRLLLPVVEMIRLMSVKPAKETTSLGRLARARVSTAEAFPAWDVRSTPQVVARTSALQEALNAREEPSKVVFRAEIVPNGELRSLVTLDATRQVKLAKEGLRVGTVKSKGEKSATETISTDRTARARGSTEAASLALLVRLLTPLAVAKISAISRGISARGTM